MEPIVDLVDALAWPIAAVWIAHLFKAEIRSLLQRITSLKYKDAEATFERGVKELAEEKPAEAPLLSDSTGAPAAGGKRYSELLRISEVSPRAAVMEAWIDVEQALLQAAEHQGLPGPKQPLSPATAREVLKKTKLTEGMVDWFDHLRKLRNEAAHADTFNPSLKSVRQYLEYTQQLVLAISLSNLEPE